MKLELHLTPYTRIFFKCFKDLKVRTKTIKVLEENIGQNLHNFRVDNDFLDMAPKGETTKHKIDKLHFMKI